MITKLPDNVDPNKILSDLVKEKYSKCPCCGETEYYGTRIFRYGINTGIFRYSQFEWYGRLGDYTEHNFLYKLKRLKEKKYHYRIDQYLCKTCGAKWETQPYPTDFISSEEASKIWNEISKVY